MREEINRADKLAGKQRNTVGFALTQLHRRLASSPEAIYQSLKRRRKRLETRLEEAKLIARGQAVGAGRPAARSPRPLVSTSSSTASRRRSSYPKTSTTSTRS